MNSRTRQWVIVFCACVFSNGALAAAYFVSPSGGDHNDGHSAAKAWKTAAKVNGAGDPKFRDVSKFDFHLQAGSPCIGAAKVEKEKIPPTDSARGPRPKLPSIGALEPDGK